VSQLVRAAVTTAPGRIEVREFARPRVEPGAVLLRVRLSGICGTDKHTFRGETKQYAGTPHERSIAYPLICGHETVGIVAELGGTVRDFEGVPLEVGDRVVPGANVPCGRCRFCLGGFPYYFCTALEDYGNSLSSIEPPHLFGGWAEYLYLLPRTPIFRVPAAVPDEVAVLTEEMAVTHGLEAARTMLGHWGGSPFGETVLVYGVGPLGLCHVAKARMTGSGVIVAFDRLPGRLRAAERLGASMTADVNAVGPAERLDRLHEITGGLGPDIVVDATGVPETFAESLRLVRYGGVIVEVGAFVDMGEIGVNPADVCAKNVTIIGIGGERATSYLPALRLMEQHLDRLPLETIVSHRVALDDAARGVELAQTDEATKVAIEPWLGREGEGEATRDAS